MNLRLTSDQYDQIEKKLDLKGDEDFAVVVQKRHNRVRYGAFVFERQPSPKEMARYEELASRVKYKGTRAEIEGSAVQATTYIFDLLIARAQDIQSGRTVYETLDRDGARKVTPVLTKREAVREFLSNVSSLTSATEDEADVEQVDGLVAAE